MFIHFPFMHKKKNTHTHTDSERHKFPLMFVNRAVDQSVNEEKRGGGDTYVHTLVVMK